MVDWNHIQHVMTDPLVEAVARCSLPTSDYRFVEPIAALRKNSEIRIVVRLFRRRPTWRSTSNSFMVLTSKGEWIWTKPITGLADVAYIARKDGDWSNAEVMTVDDDTKHIAAKFARLFTIEKGS